MGFKRVRPFYDSLPPTEKALAKVRHYKCQFNGCFSSVVDMLRDPFLPTQVKMNTYLKERKAIPRGRKHRFVLDLFACRQALPLPVKCDGRAWTKAWKNQRGFASKVVGATSLMRNI